MTQDTPTLDLEKLRASLQAAIDAGSPYAFANALASVPPASLVSALSSASQASRLREALDKSLAILATFMKMSDEAEALGGAGSISGVASLHRMQTSIQKNGPRLAALATTLFASTKGEDHG